MSRNYQKSLVLELQASAVDSGGRISDLLRMALIVATKLDLKDFTNWIELELGGYPTDDDVPKYRMLRSAFFVKNPVRGNVPFEIGDKEVIERLEHVPFKQPISEIEGFLGREHKPSASLECYFEPETQAQLMRAMAPVAFVPVRTVSLSQVRSITDAVRNVILKWALDLEKQGVLGDDMSFKKDEKIKAHDNLSIYINTFNAADGPVILGPVSGDSLVIGNNAAIFESLKGAGVSQSDRNELEAILKQYMTAAAPDRETWAKRGLKWVNDHSGTIGVLAESIRACFA